MTWEFIDTSEDGIRRSLGIFSKWQPPGGTEFKGSYADLRGSDGSTGECGASLDPSRAHGSPRADDDRSAQRRDLKAARTSVEKTVAGPTWSVAITRPCVDVWSTLRR